METIDLHLNVNGSEHSLTVPASRTLLDALRDDLGLMGAREGCGIGMCGACTALIDGHPISSCLMLAAQAVGKHIITIEGLAEDGKLGPVQQAYIDEAGFQCAYCTSGFVLTTVALLSEHPHPNEETIREYLSGNLCRCGSYLNIVRATIAASLKT